MNTYGFATRRAWCTVKARYPGMILLMRDGDTYEAFEDGDIVEAVTGRRSLPYSADADQYIAQLIQAGHKVAVCETVEAQRSSTPREPSKRLQQSVLALEIAA